MLKRLISKLTLMLEEHGDLDVCLSTPDGIVLLNMLSIEEPECCECNEHTKILLFDSSENYDDQDDDQLGGNNVVEFKS